MGGRWVVGSAVIVLLISGCLEGEAADPAPAAPATPAIDPTLPFQLGFTAGPCLEVAVGMLMDFADAQRQLPPGFRPGDAQILLGTPVPTQKALAILTTATCSASDLDATGFNEASVALTIQAPKVPGERSAAVDLYEFARATSTPNHTSLLRAVGWNQVGVVVENKLSMSQTNGVTSQIVGGGAVKDATGALYSFTLNGAPEPRQAAKGTFRWWQSVPTGLAYFDYTFDAKAYGAYPSACSIRAGTPAHKLVGASSCPAGTIGFIIPAIDAKVRFEILPGAKPA